MMKKVLIITGDAKKVEGFAHEQRYRFKRDKMTAELKTEEPAKTESKTLGNGGDGGNGNGGDTKEAPKEDTKEAPKEDSKDAPEGDSKEVKEDKKTPKKTDKK